MMLAPLASPASAAQDSVVSATEAEHVFYAQYEWCLNPHLTLDEAREHLRNELLRLPTVMQQWQLREVGTNVFLLSCGILNSVDEYLRGPALRLPKPFAAAGIVALADGAAEALWAMPLRRRREVEQWRDSWQAALHEFLCVFVADDRFDRQSAASAASALGERLVLALPADLQAKRIGIPSPFQRLDMTHHDVLALGSRLVDSHPDRERAILLIGLRTSGSYFAPLLRAFLANAGYRSVSSMSIEPNKGAGRAEARRLKHFAAGGGLGVIVDDPPHTAGTILRAVGIVRKAGFALSDLRVLAPTHRTKKDWFKTLPEGLVLTLPYADWFKPRLLEPAQVERRLADYLLDGRFVRLRVIDSAHARERNDELAAAACDERATRLKRVFSVQLETASGEQELRTVLAKSVGWGWLGYHAFVIGRRLADFVPRVLGLRDGILYMDWIESSGGAVPRNARIEAVASYVAARSRRLRLPAVAAGMDLQRQNNAIRLLEKALGRAYGALLTATLVRVDISRRLRALPCPRPAVVDGNMQQCEWIAGPQGLRKVDYEHHGMGKAAVNITDPAFDLADAMLDLGLSQDEERRLIGRYIDESGDVTVADRLFINKLLAGLWAMNEAQEQLFGPAHGERAQHHAHRRFLKAWDFLTVQTARHCGAPARAARITAWRAPLVALDVDGVIDRRLLGFPGTTAAGIEALALLNRHGCAVALNTARSAAEVKAYCEAYGLAGGIAEHGGYLWDALAQRGRALISVEAQRQLAELRSHLARVPGIFIDERHEYSIRAFTYRKPPSGLISGLRSALRASSVGDGSLAPVSALIVRQLIADLGLDLLTFHETTIDTTVTAKSADKGAGLLALRDWTLAPDALTIAVGDHRADLAQFRVATASFAPANINCAGHAGLLGCKLAKHSYQSGLLEMAQAIVGEPARRQTSREMAAVPAGEALFAEILQAADRPRLVNLARVLLSPAACRIFVR